MAVSLILTHTARMVRVVVAAAALLLTGCATSSREASEPRLVLQPSAYHAATGEDAVLIARHIPGCAQPHRLTTRHAPALASAATCQLNTNTVIVDSWSSVTDITNAVVPRPMWLVHGTTWTAFLADRGVTPSQSLFQLVLTGDVGGAARARARPPVAVSLAVQQRAAITVATGVSGRIEQLR